MVCKEIVIFFQVLEVMKYEIRSTTYQSTFVYFSLNITSFFIVQNLFRGPRQHGFLGFLETINFEKWVPGTHQFLTKLTN